MLDSFVYEVGAKMKHKVKRIVNDWLVFLAAIGVLAGLVVITEAVLSALGYGA